MCFEHQLNPFIQGDHIVCSCLTTFMKRKPFPKVQSVEGLFQEKKTKEKLVDVSLFVPTPSKEFSCFKMGGLLCIDVLNEEFSKSMLYTIPLVATNERHGLSSKSTMIMCAFRLVLQTCCLFICAKLLGQYINLITNSSNIVHASVA